MSPSDRGSHQLVPVDVTSLNRAWQPITEHYIDPHGHGANVVRLERFSTWLPEHPDTPTSVYFSDERNWIRFHDGAHPLPCCIILDIARSR